MAALYEKDLDFEFVSVDYVARKHKLPQFLALNPFGEFPAFEDGDLTLFESRAITKYVTEAYADKGTVLMLKDLKKSAIQSVWMEVENQKFDPTASTLSYELIYKPMYLGQTTDEVAVGELEKKLEDLLDVYEQRLKESKYLGGDTFTLADLHHIPNIHNLMSTKVGKLFDARPHVSAWVSDILSRPAWIKVASMLHK
ncbi:glutathione S-transferase-like protein [Tanacetum coccineum]